MNVLDVRGGPSCTICVLTPQGILSLALQDHITQPFLIQLFIFFFYEKNPKNNTPYPLFWLVELIDFSKLIVFLFNKWTFTHI